MRSWLFLFGLLVAAVLCACAGDEPSPGPEPPARPQQASELLAPPESDEQGSDEAQTQRSEPHRATQSETAVATEQAQEEVQPEGDSEAEAVVREAHRQAAEASDVAVGTDEQRSDEPQKRRSEPGRATQSETAVATDQAQQEVHPEGGSEAEATAQEAERQAEGASDAAVEAEVAETKPNPEDLVQDLSGRLATLVDDADVRMRPGLSWPVIDRLAEGDSVLVLHEAGGWYRISYGDDLQGWTRTTVLDIRDVEARRVLHQSAPPLVATWRGDRYGVRGQSADGAEVRLVNLNDESAELINAPLDEVSLVNADVKLRDLPALIGDETVVFPGDDLRAGQGRVLPKADEWMWLSRSELRGHNQHHVWLWRSDTGGLELTARPPGRAKLSPDGRHLAIARCASEERHCSWFEDAILLPLDGAQPWSVRQAVRRLRPEEELQSTFYQPHTWMQWSPDGEALLVQLAPSDDYRQWLDTVLISTVGHAMLLPAFPAGVLEGRDCLQRPPDFAVWRFRVDNTLAYNVTCQDNLGDFELLDVLFDLDGEFLRIERSSRIYRDEGDEDAQVVRSATNGHLLQESFQILWSASRQRAIVASKDGPTLWLYDVTRQWLEPVDLDAGGLAKLKHPGASIPVVWAAHWHGDSAAAVYQLVGFGSDWGAVLVDVASATAAAIDLGGDGFWPSCLPAGGWSPTGELVHAIGNRYDHSGLFPIDASYSQITFHRSDASLAYVLRTTHRHIPLKYPTSWLPAAGWSPDGEWFAVGGIQMARACQMAGP